MIFSLFLSSLSVHLDRDFRESENGVQTLHALHLKTIHVLYFPYIYFTAYRYHH